MMHPIVPIYPIYLQHDLEDPNYDAYKKIIEENEKD